MDKNVESTLLMVTSIIERCENIQPKFAEGTSQHSLLRNRIKAMYICKVLLTEQATADYGEEELMAALRQVTSIMGKCKKAQEKYEEGTSQFKRFQKQIDAMEICRGLLELK